MTRNQKLIDHNTFCRKVNKMAKNLQNYDWLGTIADDRFWEWVEPELTDAVVAIADAAGVSVEFDSEDKLFQKLRSMIIKSFVSYLKRET